MEEQLIILPRDNAIIATTILLRAKKRWKNICLSAQARLDLLFLSTMEKLSIIKTTNKNLGELPFSIYYDFETTTSGVVFFDSQMFVVSYCMVVAFHPDLKIPRLVIFRSYDQNSSTLTSLSHFQALDFNFFEDLKNFNMTTLKQLEAAAFSVWNREKNTVLAEIFSAELKFTVDCLKFLFSKNHQVLDLDIDFKTEFIQNNPPKKDDLCCLCDFLIDPRAENGWADHVFRAEHLFLENIYSKKQMRQMGIDKFEYFAQKLNKILDNLESFCASVEFKHRSPLILTLKK